MAVWYYYYSYTLMHYASFLGKLSIVNNLTGLDLTLLVIHSFIPFLVSSLVFLLCRREMGECKWRTLGGGGYKNISSSEPNPKETHMIKGTKRSGIKYTCKRIKAGCCCCECHRRRNGNGPGVAAGCYSWANTYYDIGSIPYASPDVPCRASLPFGLSSCISYQYCVQVTVAWAHFLCVIKRKEAVEG